MHKMQKIQMRSNIWKRTEVCSAYFLSTLMVYEIYITAVNSIVPDVIDELYRELGGVEGQAITQKLIFPLADGWPISVSQTRKYSTRIHHFRLF